MTVAKDADPFGPTDGSPMPELHNEPAVICALARRMARAEAHASRAQTASASRTNVVTQPATARASSRTPAL